jgi:hypothetical protein
VDLIAVAIDLVVRAVRVYVTMLLILTVCTRLVGLSKDNITFSLEKLVLLERTLSAVGVEYADVRINSISLLLNRFSGSNY